MTGCRTVVHIGADKTGSTAVQQAMATNRPRLAELGVWYPDLDGRPDHRGLLASPPAGLDAPAGLDTMVLSAEGLWSAERPVIDRLLTGLPAGPVTVVGFLRDPVDHAEAAFRQRLLLSRSERELRAVLVLRSVPARFNPIVRRAGRRLEQLDRWFTAVDALNGSVESVGRVQPGCGRDPVDLVVRRYHPADDVVVELCRAAGLDRLVPLLADRPDPRPNPRLGLDTIHASVLVRQRSGPDAQSRFLHLVTANPDPIGAGTTLLPASLRARIRRGTEPLLDRLEPRITGPAFDPPPAPTTPDAGSDGLDPVRAMALLAQIWPDFAAGHPEPSS